MDTLWRLRGSFIHTASMLYERRMKCGWAGLRVEKRSFSEKSVVFGKKGKKRNGGLVDEVVWSNLGEQGFVMKKIPYLEIKTVPFLSRMIRGAVGKKFVVKNYRGGRIVLTKFPDMSGIVPSGKQKVRRDLFREAVVYAKWIVGDGERKRAFRKTLPWRKRKHVYQAAIRLYMSMQGDKQWLRKQLAVKEVLRGMKGEGVKRESSRGGHASTGKGLFEQMGPWRVLWQKKKCTHEVVKGFVMADDLVVMRI